MKRFSLILFVIAALAACDRRPVQKDLPSSKGNPGDRSNIIREMESSPNAAAAPYELQFLDTMIAHDEAAIDAAQLVQTRSGHSELKEFARKLVSQRQSETARMHELRERFFAGASPAVNMDLPGMQSGIQGLDLEKLDSLKENGFDIEFLKEMIANQEGAVEMARDVLTKLSSDSAPNAELTDPLRQFAQSIVDTQTTEIQQMRQWQTAWTK